MGYKYEEYVEKDTRYGNDMTKYKQSEKICKKRYGKENWEWHCYYISRATGCPCPECGMLSKHAHSMYDRELQDIPEGGIARYVHLKLHTYYCDNPGCAVGSFAEPITCAAPSSRRTHELNHLILAFAMAIGNETTSRHLALIGVRVSNDSIQRLYDSIEFTDDPDIEEIGIDDVALRKGQTYATVIYDYRDHHLLALIEGRDGESIKPWLLAHPKIRLVARDRASAYASIISEIFPNCQQVADRFHLLQNLIDKLGEDMLNEELPSNIFLKEGNVLDEAPQKVGVYKTFDRRRLEGLNYDNSPPVDENGAPIAFSSNRISDSKKVLDQRRKKRIVKKIKIRSIQRYYEEMGHPPISEIAKEFHCSPATVKKYLRMTEEELQAMDHPKQLAPRKNRKGDSFINIIYKMMSDGLDNEVIFFYIKEREPDLNDSTLANYMQAVARNFPGRPLFSCRNIKQSVYPEDVTVIKRSALQKAIMSKDPKVLKDTEVQKAFEHLEQICDKYPIVRGAQIAFDEFHSILMGDDPDAMIRFAETYEESEIGGFCEGLKKDIASVRNAISLEVSSGFVEGSNNRFKLLKRSVYGRAGIVNLEKKCKLAFWEKKATFNLWEIVTKRVAR